MKRLAFSGWRDARSLALLEAELAEREASVQALEAELRATLDPQALAARLDALASELAAKQRVLEVLGGEGAANGEGFSDALRGFSSKTAISPKTSPRRKIPITWERLALLTRASTLPLSTIYISVPTSS